MMSKPSPLTCGLCSSLPAGLLPSFLLWPSRLEAAQIAVRINLLQPKLEPAISLLRASHRPLFLESQNRPWPTRLWTYRSLPPSHLRSLGLTALCWPSCSFSNLASINPQLRCVPALFFVSKALLLAVNLMHSLTSVTTSHGGLSWLSTYLLHLLFPFSSQYLLHEIYYTCICFCVYCLSTQEYIFHMSRNLLWYPLIVCPVPRTTSGVWFLLNKYLLKFTKYV